MFCVYSVSLIHLLKQSCSKRIAQVCMVVNCGRLPIPLLNSSALISERLAWSATLVEMFPHEMLQSRADHPRMRLFDIFAPVTLTLTQ